ncbi:MAG: nucleotidyl transferase AbiEii/AbiGii toxin family protein [Bacteroidales bacterium]|jgi:predicted nucleotidyltransferase component of viral defense system|nr:nucleotidyl transferase AbiEii/AbiGii toxin family protein [Bacteroidales bacterium]
MISIEAIRNFYPPAWRNNSLFEKYMLKEYVQLMILDFLSTSPFIRKVCFIGGTSIRLIKGIDRFSEDLDFDCKEFSEEEFIKMTDSIIQFLRNNGLSVEAKDKPNSNLKAFRRNIHFPKLLFELGLSGHREERFLIKIESQDQLVKYDSKIVNIKGCGFFFPMPVPSDEVLCAMKLSAMLDRQKGRDFYDAMFLLSQTLPDFNFLHARAGISNMEDLKQEASKVFNNIDLKSKMKDFEHLLFNKNNSIQILRIPDFFREL